jgi:hypothetical protein
MRSIIQDVSPFAVIIRIITMAAALVEKLQVRASVPSAFIRQDWPNGIVASMPWVTQIADGLSPDAVQPLIWLFVISILSVKTFRAERPPLFPGVRD